jgi:hypothetical protein
MDEQAFGVVVGVMAVGINNLIRLDGYIGLTVDPRSVDITCLSLRQNR